MSNKIIISLQFPILFWPISMPIDLIILNLDNAEFAFFAEWGQ